MRKAANCSKKVISDRNTLLNISSKISYVVSQNKLLKREEKLAEGKKVRKKRAKKTQNKRGGKKKRGCAGPKKKSVGKAAKKVKLLLKNDSPQSNHAAGEENKESQVNLAGAPPRPDRVNSVQKNTFLDRRLNTEAFLLSLEENH